MMVTEYLVVLHHYGHISALGTKLLQVHVPGVVILLVLLHPWGCSLSTVLEPSRVAATPELVN